MFRALILAAVSSVAQAAADKASLPAQLDLARNLCAARHWRVVEEIVIEGHSRNYLWLHQLCKDSAEYGRLVDLIEAERIDLIVVRDHDRLWRTDALRAQLMALCRSHHVQVYSINQPSEPILPELLSGASNDSALILEALGGVISETENRTRQRRRAVGMAARHARGLANMGHVPYGYIRVATKAPFAVNPDQAVWVREMYRMVLAGVSTNAVTDHLNASHVPTATGAPWTRGTVTQLLHNPIFCGRVTWHGETATGQHEVLVSVADWERVQAVLAERTNGKRATTKGLLAGLLRCGYCGWHMIYMWRPVHWRDREGPHQFRLACGQYMHTRGRECQNNGVKASVIEEAARVAVQQALADPAAWIAQQAAADDHSDELATLRAAIDAENAKHARWNTLYESGGIDGSELLLHRAEIASRITALQTQARRLENDATAQATRLANLTRYASATNLAAASPDELRETYHALIRRISVSSGAIAITWW